MYKEVGRSRLFIQYYSILIYNRTRACLADRGVTAREKSFRKKSRSVPVPLQNVRLVTYVRTYGTGYDLDTNRSATVGSSVKTQHGPRLERLTRRWLTWRSACRTSWTSLRTPGRHSSGDVYAHDPRAKQSRSRTAGKHPGPLRDFEGTAPGLVALLQGEAMLERLKGSLLGRSTQYGRLALCVCVPANSPADSSR